LDSSKERNREEPLLLPDLISFLLVNTHTRTLGTAAHTSLVTLYDFDKYMAIFPPDRSNTKGKGRGRREVR
jgi:hypothetical protein